MLVKIRSGLINTDAIKAVTQNDNDYVAHLNDGGRIDLNFDDYLSIAGAAVTVPAEPGYELRVLNFDEVQSSATDPDRYNVWSYPIIAWRISCDGTNDPVAITPCGTFENDQHVAVVCPGGMTIEPEMGSYRDFRDWVAELRRRRTKAVVE